MVKSAPKGSWLAVTSWVMLAIIVGSLFVSVGSQAAEDPARSAVLGVTLGMTANQVD